MMATLHRFSEDQDRSKIPLFDVPDAPKGQKPKKIGYGPFCVTRLELCNAIANIQSLK